jgi:protein-disulfide isomerase
MAHGTQQAPAGRTWPWWAFGTLVAAAIAAGPFVVHVVPYAPVSPAALEAADASAGPDFAGLRSVPSVGAADPLVVVLLASDFQCPYCSLAEDAVRDLLGEHRRDMRLYFLNRPLGFHEHARPAALAALAAAGQGRFFAYAESLFARQDLLDDDALVARAAGLGLDVARFQADRASPATAARLDRAADLAERAGASGTPYFVVNGHVLPGARPPGELSAEVAEAAAQVGALVAGGLSSRDALRAAIARAHPRGEDFARELLGP